MKSLSEDRDFSYENKKGNIICMIQGGICSLTDCDNIFPTISFVLVLKL